MLAVAPQDPGVFVKNLELSFWAAAAMWCHAMLCPPLQILTFLFPSNNLASHCGIPGKCYCCCSDAKSCLTLCNPMDWSTPGFPILHHLLELAQTHVHWISDAIQPSRPLLPPSPPAPNLSQHQGLFQWAGSLHQVAKVLEFQHQSFQWIFRVDFL